MTAANTAFISEKLITAFDLGWLSGTRSTLRNVGQGIVRRSTRFPNPRSKWLGPLVVDIPRVLFSWAPGLIPIRSNGSTRSASDG